MNEKRHIVLMGISGSGKTTAAQGLQKHFNCPYAEGDAFHSQENRDKMGAGIPLTDEDRLPWLQSLRDWMSEQSAEHDISIVTCSALKRAYRDLLREANGRVLFVHLNPPLDINKERISARKGHYMKANMLDSQIAILELLQNDEEGVVISNETTPKAALDDILAWLKTL